MTCTHEVAAVGQPLGLGVEAPDVAGPRAAVHVEHGRAGSRRLDARREGEVAVDGQAVAGGEGERLHLGQLVLRQGGLVLEQERRLLGVPVVGVVADRPVVVRVGHQPGAVGVVVADEGQVARVDGAAGRRRRRRSTGRGPRSSARSLMNDDQPGAPGVGVEADAGHVVLRVLGDDRRSRRWRCRAAPAGRRWRRPTTPSTGRRRRR